MNSDKLFYVLVAVFTILLFVGILFMASKPSVTKNPNTQESENISVQDLVGSDPHTTLPIDEAKVVVVEFGDFECPACKTAWSEVARVKEDYKDTVAFVYRQFPLTSIHTYAYNAAVASEASASQGKFFEYYDLLFKNQTDNQNPLKEEDYVSFAEELKLDVDKFKNDYSDNATKDKVKEDMNYGNSLGINSTPTFFVNDKKVDFDVLYDTVKDIVDKISEEPTPSASSSPTPSVSPTE